MGVIPTKEEKNRTSTLLRKLKGTRDFHSYIQTYENDLKDTALSQVLDAVCREKDLVPERVIKAAQIDRTYGHQIFNGTRKPSRDKVIQLAFGFGMPVEEAQRLLQAAGKNQLYPRLKRDAAILFCLSKSMNVLEAQSLLESLDLTLLGDDWQRGG